MAARQKVNSLHVIASFVLGDHKPYEGSHARGREALVYEITEMRTGPNRSLKTSKMAAMKSNAPHE